MTSNNFIISTESLSKHYSHGDHEIPVLDDVNFSVRKGEIIALLGPSGIGKSTFLQVIGTLDSPSAGNFFIKGISPLDLDDSRLSRFRNEHIGFIFQFHHLLPEFSALENTMMPGLIAGMRFDDAKKRAAELLDQVGLRNRVSHKPAELSGGEKQRVAVVRALMNQPDVILADEPTGNLDPQNSEILMKIIVDLNNTFHQSFIIATHNRQIAEYAGRKFMIEDRKLREY